MPWLDVLMGNAPGSHACSGSDAGARSNANQRLKLWWPSTSIVRCNALPLEISRVWRGVMDMELYRVCEGALVVFGVAPSNNISMKWSLAMNGIELVLSAWRNSMVHSFGVPAFRL